MTQKTKFQNYSWPAILAWGETFIYQTLLLRYVMYEPLRESLALIQIHAQFGDLHLVRLPGHSHLSARGLAGGSVFNTQTINLFLCRQR